MIRKCGSFIEISPMNYSNGAHVESVSIDTNTRLITSIHTHEPRSDKCKKIFTLYKQMYNMVPQCTVLEIVTEPSVKSLSMKTISYELVYFLPHDYNGDIEKLKNFIYYGTPIL